MRIKNNPQFFTKIFFSLKNSLYIRSVINNKNHSKMRLQVIREVSKTEKAVNIEFLHPRTLRHHFAWLPISQIEYLPMNEIKIPDWLWNNIKKKI